MQKYLLIIFLFINSIANGQWYNPEKVNKKALLIFENAYTDARNNNYANAISKLNEALKIDSNYLDAIQARAGMYAATKNYTNAIKDYDLFFAKDTLYAREYLPEYANAYAGAGNFEKALQKINTILAAPNLSEQKKQGLIKRKNNYEFAILYAKNNIANGYIFNPKNMGDAINSTALEYLPSLTVDGNKMVFNRRINGDEDFYESIKQNGVWQNAVPMPGKINTNLNEGAQNISQDGQVLIFTGCNYPEGAGSCDLYISYKDKNGVWSEATNMGEVINTESWETSPSLSPDKRDLYFASTRLGGLGGSDIWVSHFENNKWQKPENLGPEINTTGNESCPFIHADNATLYFNSNGHIGYGQNDLFVSRRKENNIWQKPENLGYPINTIDDEGSLIVAADGKTAFYASDKGDAKNKIDLYSFELRENIKATKTLWVKGKVYDKKTNAGLQAEVELTNIENGNVVSKLITDADGNYLITLPAGKNYAFGVLKKGYLFYSDNFSLKENKLDSPLILNIPLQPIEKGSTIVLKNIFFDTKKAALQKASFIELDKVVKLLAENTNITILITGHTDNVGQAKDNITLSNNRAKAVTNYLIQKGISAKRLTAKGFGSTKPIDVNTTENGRAKNRRTELSIISN
jgi:outer membrane protein OmpA-like peptidoglycan-associated protein/tetratricopeptide (TPR) repeat protein